MSVLCCVFPEVLQESCHGPGLHDGLADGLGSASLQTCKHRIVPSPLLPKFWCHLPMWQRTWADSSSQMDTWRVREQPLLPSWHPPSRPQGPLPKTVCALNHQCHCEGPPRYFQARLISQPCLLLLDPATWPYGASFSGWSP